METSAGIQNRKWISILCGQADEFRISYSILTTPRKEPFFQRTVESLEATGFFQDKRNLPLHIVSGAPGCGYPVGFDPRPDRFQSHPMTPEEAEKLAWSIAGAPLRATWGHWRCLAPERTSPGSTFVLVMEDDLRFAAGWLDRLKKIVREIAYAFSDEWLLTLYTPGSTAPLSAFREGKKWIQRSHDGFYGTQAIVYPLTIRDAYLEHVSSADWSTHLPHDLSLPFAMKQLGIPILASAPCLVQHMGLVSEGVSGSQHQSLSFLERI